MNEFERKLKNWEATRSQSATPMIMCAVVTLPPTLAVATLMQQIKGGTSHAWNRAPHSSQEHGAASLFEMWLDMKKPGKAGTSTSPAVGF